MLNAWVSDWEIGKATLNDHHLLSADGVPEPWSFLMYPAAVCWLYIAFRHLRSIESIEE